MDNKICGKCKSTGEEDNKIRKNGMDRVYSVSGAVTVIQKYICQSCAHTNHYYNRKKNRVYNEFSLCKLDSVL